MPDDFDEVWSIMHGDVRTVAPGDRLDLANVVMKLGGIRHLPVVEAGVLVGIVSQRDLLSAALSSVLERGSREAQALRGVLVRDVMTRDPYRVGIKTSVRDAAEQMLERQIGCVPVVNDHGALLGIVSETDLIRAAYGIHPG